jgi:hypothetical protein
MLEQSESNHVSHFIFPFKDRSSYLSTSLCGSAVGITTGYLNDHGVGIQVRVASRILFSTSSPGQLWSAPSLLSNGYRKEGGVKRWAVKMTTHLQLLQRSRKRGSICPRPHISGWGSVWILLTSLYIYIYIYIYIYRKLKKMMHTF